MGTAGRTRGNSKSDCYQLFDDLLPTFTQRFDKHQAAVEKIVNTKGDTRIIENPFYNRKTANLLDAEGLKTPKAESPFKDFYRFTNMHVIKIVVIAMFAGFSLQMGSVLESSSEDFPDYACKMRAEIEV